MRACHPQQHVADGNGDREQDAVKDVEGENAGARGHREQELAAAERGEPPERARVDQQDSGVDDDRAERRAREAGEHGPQNKQHANHRGERGKRVHLSTAACRPANGRAAGAAAHREAAEQARTDIRHAERQQFLVGVDRSSSGRANDRAVSTSSLKATRSTLSAGNSRIRRSSG